MAIFRQSGYNGTPDGNVIAAAEGASTMIGPGTAVYVADTFRGSACGRFDSTDGTRVISTDFSDGSWWWAGWVRIQTTPTALVHLSRSTVLGGTAGVTGFGVNASSQWVLRSGSGGTVTASSSSTFSLDTWYGVVYNYNRATNQHHLSIYDSSAVLIESISGSGDSTTINSQREGVQTPMVGLVVDYVDTILADEPVNLTTGSSIGYFEDFENVGDSVSLTSGNTSFDAVTGSGVAVGTTTNPLHDTVSALVAPTSFRQGEWNQTFPGYAQIYAEIVTMPTTNSVIALLRVSGTAKCQIYLNSSTGQLCLRNGATEVAATSKVFSEGDKFRVDWRVTGTAQTARLFYGSNREGTVPNETLGPVAANADTSGIPNENFFLCPVAATDAEWKFDSIGMYDAWPGPIGDPIAWRESYYSGTPGTAVNAVNEGADGVFGPSTATYQAGGLMDDGYARILGQRYLQTERTFGDDFYQASWVRPVDVPDSNRNLCTLASDTATQASIGIDTNSKWRLREVGGLTVDTSVSSWIPGSWYGIIWHVSASGTQTLEIYDTSLTLIETLSGNCGTAAYTVHREGCVQGTATWNIDYDYSIIAGEPVMLPLPHGAGGDIRFVYFDGISEVPLEAIYFDGVDEIPITPETSA